MYPILMRLADRGQVETAWEEHPPRGRPPRHLYRLSPAGAELVAELRAELPRRAVAAAGEGHDGIAPNACSPSRRRGCRRGVPSGVRRCAPSSPRSTTPTRGGASRAVRRRPRSRKALGLRIAFAFGTGVVVAALTLTASRMQLQAGGPGVLSVTVPVPAFLLLTVGFWPARGALVPLRPGDRLPRAGRGFLACPRSSRSKDWSGWTATACSCSTAIHRGIPSTARRRPGPLHHGHVARAPDLLAAVAGLGAALGTRLVSRA